MDEFWKFLLIIFCATAYFFKFRLLSSSTSGLSVVSAMFLRLIVATLCLASLGVNGSPPLQLEPQRGLPFEPEFIQQRRADTRFRLPKTVAPKHYKLDIIPILDNSLEAEGKPQFSAPGTVEITVTCVEATSSITLHSQDIAFLQADVTIEGTGTVPTVVGLTFDADTTTATITLSADLVKDQEYTIVIKFVSQVNTGLDGLYRSYYVDDAGEERWLATTQFEATGARKAFPCFDEPALRATFEVRIGRRNDNGYHSLCNTEHTGTPTAIPDYPTNWVYDSFSKTVVMPTYLVAIIVSDFKQQLAPGGIFRTPVSTWGPPNQVDDKTAAFSAQVAAKLLRYFETYFESPYQLSKLDSVAIPQFAAGAMENWGLNTYRVNLMLFFDGESTQFEQWRQAAVIAHEVSHHWFGDLVTMNWWNEAWLKEGFARYLQFLGVQDAEEQLEAMNRVVVDTIQLAMENDILPASHPIRGEWTSDIQSYNSRIIYEKGASLIRMMQAFLSEKTLQAGMKEYLRTYAYGSAIQDQLFEILTTQAHTDETLPVDISVKDIMDSWTLQSGFPVLHVSRASKTRVHFTQTAFGPVIANEGYDGPFKGTWEIPVTYATKAQPDFTETNWSPKFWFHTDVVLVAQNVDNTDEWILVNPDARSYYRVLYDAHFENLLKTQLDSDHTVISPSSRSQLIDDYFASAYISPAYTTIDKALDFTKYLHKEDKLVVWTTALLQLKKAYTLLTETEAIADFKAYVGTKILPQLTLIGPDFQTGESPITSMLRTQFLDWACSIGLDICYETSTALVEEWRTSSPMTNTIQADIQPMIYCGAFAKGTTTLSDFIKAQYFNTALTARNRGLLLNALACGLEIESLQAALTMALDTTNQMPVSDRKTLIEKVAGNAVARPAVLKFLTDNKATIRAIFGDEEPIKSTVEILSTYFHSDNHVSQLEAFIAANSDLAAETVTSIQASIAKVKTNQEWIAKHYQTIADWLAAEKQSRQ